MGKVKLFLFFLLLSWAVVFFVLGSAKTVDAQNYNFPLYTVTNILVVPQDVEMDPEYPRLVSEAVRRVQERYAEILGGPTFQINSSNNGDVIIYKSSKKLRDFATLNVVPYLQRNLKMQVSLSTNLKLSSTLSLWG